jgi:hypothetical protein
MLLSATRCFSPQGTGFRNDMRGLWINNQWPPMTAKRLGQHFTALEKWKRIFMGSETKV